MSKRVAGGFGPGFPNTEDYYPSISKQLGEEGATASDHYRPDTEDGRPQQSCFAFRIRFQVRR